MQTTDVALLIALISLLTLIWGVVTFLFRRGRRRCGAKVAGLSTLALVVTAYMLGVADDREAIAAGFASGAERREAKDFGIDDPAVWRAESDALREQAAIKAAAVAKAARPPEPGRCEVLLVEDISAGDQLRMTLFVASDTAVGKDGVATAKLVAKEALGATGWDYAKVFLVPSDAMRDGEAPDGGHATVVLGHAPRPQRIPFMNAPWDVRYADAPSGAGTVPTTEPLPSRDVEALDVSERGDCALATVREAVLGGLNVPEQTPYEAQERYKGFHCLSGWDGAHPGLKRAVKAALRDPDSFEHAETRVTPADVNGRHRITMTYRARNGFGGMNVTTAHGTYGTRDCQDVEVTALQ